MFLVDNLITKGRNIMVTSAAKILHTCSGYIVGLFTGNKITIVKIKENNKIIFVSY